jgi:sortase (surface protein transpeptidase)
MRDVGEHSTVAPPRHGSRRLRVFALAISWCALSVAGLNSDVSSARAPTPPQAVVAGNQVTAPPTQPRASEPRVTRKLGRAPVHISIPGIQVTADITKLGLNKDGTVEVPEDPDDAGWYRNGPMPGEPGSAVILGHVDSKVGPAVFYRLKDLDPGDQIAVGLDSGSVAHFEVTQVAHYAIEDFPRHKVYAGTPDRPALNLVTCGGKYDREAGGYQSNVVVYTTLLWVTDGVRHRTRSTGFHAR